MGTVSQGLPLTFSRKINSRGYKGVIFHSDAYVTADGVAKI